MGDNTLRTLIENYWQTGNYRPLQPFTINDFCHLWAEEEGIILNEGFSVSEHNSLFFTKMNSEKHAMNLILQKFGYPIIETESLPLDLACATMRAVQLYRQNSHGMIRANRMAGGGGTFKITDENQIKMMISTLFHHPKGLILPLYSPYYEFEIEYAVFQVAGSTRLVIAKHKNPSTGLHNLSLGARATIVEDEEIRQSLTNVCMGLSDLLGANFVRWDIAATSEGYKIVEASVPNFKKFALQDHVCMQQAKKLFLSYYSSFYK